MSNKVLFLFISIVLFALPGCEESGVPERRKEETPRRRSVMSPSTSFTPSGEDTLVYSLSGNPPAKEALKKLFNSTFGVISAQPGEKSVVIIYDPSHVSPDSITKLLVKNNIGIQK